MFAVNMRWVGVTDPIVFRAIFAAATDVVIDFHDA